MIRDLETLVFSWEPAYMNSNVKGTGDEEVVKQSTSKAHGPLLGAVHLELKQLIKVVLSQKGKLLLSINAVSICAI